MNIGLVYIIVAQFFWAGELILIRKFFPTQNSIFISAITSIIGSFFYLPAIFLIKQKLIIKDWFVLLILGFTAWFLAQIFYVTGIQKGPSAFIITLTTLTFPLFAVIMGSLLLKEPIGLKAIIGGVFMIVGFLLISSK